MIREVKGGRGVRVKREGWVGFVWWKLPVSSVLLRYGVGP